MALDYKKSPKENRIALTCNHFLLLRHTWVHMTEAGQTLGFPVFPLLL